MSTLDTNEIEQALTDLDGWSHADEAIHKTFEFDAFMDAIGFIDRIAEEAEDANHHPELRNVYTTVDVSLTTHSEGGVTEKDVAMAEAIDAVA